MFCVVIRLLHKLSLEWGQSREILKASKRELNLQPKPLHGGDDVHKTPG